MICGAATGGSRGLILLAPGRTGSGTLSLTIVRSTGLSDCRDKEAFGVVRPTFELLKRCHRSKPGGVFIHVKPEHIAFESNITSLHTPALFFKAAREIGFSKVVTSFHDNQLAQTVARVELALSHVRDMPPRGSDEWEARVWSTYKAKLEIVAEGGGGTWEDVPTSFESSIALFNAAVRAARQNKFTMLSSSFAETISDACGIEERIAHFATGHRSKCRQTSSRNETSHRVLTLEERIGRRGAAHAVQQLTNTPYEWMLNLRAMKWPSNVARPIELLTSTSAPRPDQVARILRPDPRIPQPEGVAARRTHDETSAAGCDDGACCCCRSYYDITQCPATHEISGPWKRTNNYEGTMVDGELKQKVYCCKRLVACETDGGTHGYAKELQELTIPRKEGCAAGSDLESGRRRTVTGADLQSESRRRRVVTGGFCCCRSYYDITTCTGKDEVSGPWKRNKNNYEGTTVDGELKQKVYCCKRQALCDNSGESGEGYQKELYEVNDPTTPRKDECAPGSDLQSRRRGGGQHLTGGTAGFCCCRSYYDITTCSEKGEVSGPWKRTNNYEGTTVDGELKQKVYCCKALAACETSGESGKRTRRSCRS